MIMLECYSL